jgi:hypothetical protein
MRAELKNLDLDPDPEKLYGDPAGFVTTARIVAGPEDGPGEESFAIVICTPEWLADACRKAGGIYNARHHLVVDSSRFDRDTLNAWLAARVRETEADTWPRLATRLSHLAYWEFEDYDS